MENKDPMEVLERARKCTFAMEGIKDPLEFVAAAKELLKAARRGVSFLEEIDRPTSAERIAIKDLSDATARATAAFSTGGGEK